MQPSLEDYCSVCHSDLYVNNHMVLMNKTMDFRSESLGLSHVLEILSPHTPEFVLHNKKP